MWIPVFFQSCSDASEKGGKMIGDFQRTYLLFNTSVVKKVGSVVSVSNNTKGFSYFFIKIMFWIDLTKRGVWLKVAMLIIEVWLHSLQYFSNWEKLVALHGYVGQLVRVSLIWIFYCEFYFRSCRWYFNLNHYMTSFWSLVKC